jgi:NADH oxidase (H2O2-forming)
MRLLDTPTADIQYSKRASIYRPCSLEEVATTKIVVVGGGAGGIGAAGAARGTDKNADVVVYTEYEDAAYSPCGIPYVHGKEIPDFQSLFLATKDSYREAGIDIHYETAVTGLDVAKKTVTVAGQGEVSWDRLVLATGFTYADPGVPGSDLEGLYYVKNIRQAMEWDKVLDTTKVAVVVEASPLGLEMVTALAHRGIETHVVDPHPWALAEATDPDIAAPVEESWAEMGVKMHFNTGGCGRSGPTRASCRPTWWSSAPRSAPTPPWPPARSRSGRRAGSSSTSAWPPPCRACTRRATASRSPTA